MTAAPWDEGSKESSFLKSGVTTENRFQTQAEFFRWFRSRRHASSFEVRPIPFAEMDQWYFAPNPYRLAHRSGQFFTIEGIRVSTNYGPIRRWDQPVIRQPEIGILGIVTKISHGVRYFLFQAKMEPGNVNTLQLSPSVQATKSNYTQVHKGKRTRYLEYFVEPGRSRILIDQLQTEQGLYFLRKRNRNMVVEVDDDIPLHDDFCWLTLAEIKQLMSVDNLVNMDSRSVLSCIPLVDGGWRRALFRGAGEISIFGQSLSGFRRDVLSSLLCRRGGRHTMDEVLGWLTRAKSEYEMTVDRMPLDEIRDWVLSDRDIHHQTRRHSSVIAVSVAAGSREVVQWTQPLLKQTAHGLCGFLAQKSEGTLHFLARASLEPGNVDGVNVGPTVSCSRYQERMGEADRPRFLELFVGSPGGGQMEGSPGGGQVEGSPGGGRTGGSPEGGRMEGCRPEQVRYDAIQSEEGGRFSHFQNRYMIVELAPEETLQVSGDYLWMTLGQIFELLRFGHLNIEARSLMSCLSLRQKRDHSGQESADS